MKTEFTKFIEFGILELYSENSVDSVSNSAPLRFCGERELRSWLPDMDLNHDKVIQSHLCYRYTIGQAGALRKLNTFLFQSRLVQSLKRSNLNSGAICRQTMPIQRFNCSTIHAFTN